MKFLLIILAALGILGILSKNIKNHKHQKWIVLGFMILVSLILMIFG